MKNFKIEIIEPRITEFNGDFRNFGIDDLFEFLNMNHN